jgi:hypothetical protein
VDQEVAERGLTPLRSLARLVRLDKDLPVAMEQCFHHLGIITLSLAAVVVRQVSDQTALIIRTQLRVAPAPLTLTQIQQQYMRRAEMVH